MKKDRGSITPEKRGSHYTGKWYADVPALEEGVGSITGNVKHPRFRRRFDSERQARMYRDHVNEHHAEPEWCKDPLELQTPPGDPSTTLGAVAARAEKAGGLNGVWLDGRDPSGAACRARVVEWLGPGTQIAQIDRNALEGLVAGLRGRPGHRKRRLSNGTIRHYLSAIRSILAYAEAHNLIPAIPRAPKVKRPKGKIVWFTEQQEAAIRKVMEERALTRPKERGCSKTMDLLCRTGLRWGEFEQLTRNDILDPLGEDPMARIRIGYGADQKTKTDRPRTIRIPVETAAELRALMASGDKPRRRTFADCLAAAVKACGYPEELTPHCCRHTTATRLAIARAEPFDIMQFMGHDDIKTTMLYVHLRDELLVGVAEKLWGSRGNASENTSGHLKIVK